MVALGRILGFLGLICVACALNAPGSTTVGGVIETKGSKVYHGVIKEDAVGGTSVELDVPLFIEKNKDPVCGFTVFKSGALPIPFQVVLNDPKTGGADIILGRDQKLNFELTSNYQFEIAADDCATGAHSPIRDVVHIEVEDVNDFAPLWSQQTYTVEAVEGVLYKKLLQLHAIDGDGTPAFSKICHYILLTDEVPFKIDEQGYLENTEPLDYSTRHNFILEVVAEDCAQKRSDRLLVNIIVKPECKTGWQGLKNTIDYTTVSSHQSLADNATLELCGAVCEIKEVTLTLKLLSDHKDSASCPVDTKSLANRNAFCGVSPSAVSLLPAVQPDKESVFVFDGKSVAYPVDSVKVKASLQGHFTLSTWMRHVEQSADMEELKQHILCNADNEGMNRHHYSLFLHNCRLILLVRQEPGEDVDLNVFKPAEWRWKIDEVCDGAWHHYAISMDFPTVRLYVDGRLVVNSKHNPAVIDDWPLHPSKKVKGTKLVVGACWEGTEQHYSQFLHADLAELTLMNNETESDQVIQCLNNCHEKLDFHAISEMESGMSISMNSEMSQLSITGHSKQSVEKLLSRVGYINSRVISSSMSGNTLITADTSVTCSDGSNLSVAAASVVINLQSERDDHVTDESSLSLGASTQLTREEGEMKEGVKIFPDIVIYHHSDYATKDVEDGVVELNSCIVHTERQLDPTVERIHFSLTLANSLNLKIETNSHGLNIVGPAKLTNFVDMLRDLHYQHDRPEEMRSLSFSVMCSQQKGLTVSNQLIVELNVIHESHLNNNEAGHAVISKQQHEQPSVNKLLDETKPVDKHASGLGMALIVVVCVGFLLFMIVVAVMRVRTAHTRRHHTMNVNVEERQEMEWDNSSLTITVNPMERETVYDETEMNGLHGDETDSEDDIGSFHDDGPDSTDEEQEREKDREKDSKTNLEWDNSSTAAY